MAWLVIAFSLVISAPALAASAPAKSIIVSPDDRAKQWMTLIDDQNYAEAYQQMGAAGRGKAAIDPWTQKIRGAREPLGAVSSRALKDVKMTKTFPGTRDGQYATVRYDSAFAHKAGVETVTLALENGAWSVIGYFFT